MARIASRVRGESEPRTEIENAFHAVRPHVEFRGVRTRRGLLVEVRPVMHHHGRRDVGRVEELLQPRFERRSPGDRIEHRTRAVILGFEVGQQIRALRFHPPVRVDDPGPKIRVDDRNLLRRRSRRERGLRRRGEAERRDRDEGEEGTMHGGNVGPPAIRRLPRRGTPRRPRPPGREEPPPGENAAG